MYAMIAPVGGQCNIRCKYCFNTDEEKSGKLRVMPSNMAVEFIDQLFDIEPDNSVCFHGGEPLCAGVGFYQSVLPHLNNKGCKDTGIQTNGTLLSDAMLDILLQYGVSIGISIDGDGVSHNANRINSDGVGTFFSVVRGITRLKNRGKPIKIIQCLTEDSNRPEENFEFFVKDLRVQSWAINPAEGLISPENASDYIQKVMDLWIRHGDTKIHIRELAACASLALGLSPRCCSWGKCCGEHILLSNNGDVFPCNRLMREEFKLGRFPDQPLREIIDGPRSIGVTASLKRGYPECTACSVEEQCTGGCPAQRLETGFAFCATRRSMTKIGAQLKEEYDATRSICGSSSNYALRND